MTREEELVRIAKKLDKMVSRNNTVRLYFDTHRWRVVLRTRPYPPRGSPSRSCGKAAWFQPKSSVFVRPCKTIPTGRAVTNGRQVSADRGTRPSVRVVHLLTVSRLVWSDVSKQRGLCGRSRRSVAAGTCVSAIATLPLAAAFLPDTAAATVAGGFFAKLLHVYWRTSSSPLD